MPDDRASLSVDVHPSKAKQTLFSNDNSFWIASTVSAYSLRQMLVKVVADSSTSLQLNALYDHRSSRFDIALHGIWDAGNLNIR